MKYNYSFFKAHAERKWKLQVPTVHYVGCAISDFFLTEGEAIKHYEIIFRPENIRDFDTPSIVRCNGAYFKGGGSVAPLEDSLRAKLPEDFVQFYEQFGECVIITRSEPILIYSLDRMVRDFEDDPDIEIEEGRFFRFACYQDPLYLGLRRDDRNDEWQVVICTYGLLYSEMIGPEGRGNVVAPSFYEWLRHLIESNGCPDKIYPRDEWMTYLTVLE